MKEKKDVFAIINGRIRHYESHPNEASGFQKDAEK